MNKDLPVTVASTRHEGGRAMIGSARQNTPCIPSNVKLSSGVTQAGWMDDTSKRKCTWLAHSMIGGHPTKQVTQDPSRWIVWEESASSATFISLTHPACVVVVQEVAQEVWENSSQISYTTLHNVPTPLSLLEVSLFFGWNKIWTQCFSPSSNLFTHSQLFQVQGVKIDTLGWLRLRLRLGV